MSKKKLCAIAMCILFALLVNLFIFTTVKPNVNNGNCEFQLTMSSDKAIGVQIFYSESMEFSEGQMLSYDYTEVNMVDRIVATLPIKTNYIRIDFGSIANNVEITDAQVNVGKSSIYIEPDYFLNPFMTNFIDSIRYEDDKICIRALDVDPYIIIPIDSIKIQETYKKANDIKYLTYDIVLCLAVNLLTLLCIFRVKTFVSIPLDIYRNRDIIWDLVKNDFQARFAGSYFGIFWAFVQPVITMVLYWFVFQVGLRSGNVSDYPFILFLMSGLIPWFYFSEAWMGGTNSLIEYSYLVKKVVFEVRILPVVKTSSSIFVHLFFVAFLIIICACYGFTPDLYMLQVFYYIICSCFLVLGISYITSACTVFFRDMTQIINIVLTIGVWLTPIMWNPVGTLPPVVQTIFRLNPMYYIVDGFRDSLLAKQWFWNKPIWTVYFWLFSITVYMLGVSLFNRLKVHFSDVL